MQHLNYQTRRAKIAELHNAGLDRQQIARQLGVAPNRVKVVLREMGLVAKQEQRVDAEIMPRSIPETELPDEAISICLNTIDLAIRRGNRDEAVAAIDRLMRDTIETVTLDSHVSELDISVRTANRLEDRGVDCVRDLVECNAATLGELSQFGPNAILEIERALEKIGLKLQKAGAMLSGR